jgi:hypothetical protein
MTRALSAGLLGVVLVIAACGGDDGPDAPDCSAGNLDLVAKLRCVPGLEITSQPDSGISGYQRFDFTLTQAVDHDHPDAGTFTQRGVLLHTSDTAPMVLFTSGYGKPNNPTLTEVARTFGANQITYEHRYFVASRPAPLDWTKLNIKQAAADAHHIVESLRPLYSGKWLNTGGSKGGMTSVYHRRFYPDDVDATLAYVAPSGDSLADPAYNDFIDQVGGPDLATCRDNVLAFIGRLLDQRQAIEPLVKGTFTLIPLDKAFEITALELSFVFWQYTSPTNTTRGCSLIPGSDATPERMLAFLELHSPVDDSTGAASLDYYHAFFHQTAEQLGYPAPDEAPFGAKVVYPGADEPATYLPPGEPGPFDPAAMADVDGWVASTGSRLMFIYGQLDPWSARQFRPDAANDSFKFVVAGGNHGSNIAQLSTADKASALAALGRWLGVAPVTALRSRSVTSADGDERIELGGQRPPL